MKRAKESDDPTGIVMLRVPEICERMSVSVSYLYSLIGRDLFPKLVPLDTRSRGLPEHVLDAWLWQCLTLRESMRTLRDPVVLLKWPPEAIVPSPVRGIRMLRLSTVERRVGLKSSHIYRNIEAGVFPRPAPLGPRVRRWPAHDVERWTRGRLRMLDRLRGWYLRPPRDDDDDHPGPGSPA